jgi:protein archease
MALESNIPPPGWEHFPHGADVGIRGRGRTLAQAFEQVALALTGIVTDADIADQTQVEVECEAADVEVLLVEWLNATIYEMAVRNMIFGAFLSPNHIFAKQHQPKAKVKRRQP